jgi:signal transduction histidine kinase
VHARIATDLSRRSHMTWRRRSVLRNTVQLARHRSAAHEVDLGQLLNRLDTASARATSLLRMLSDAQAIESDGFDLDIGSHDLVQVITPIVSMMDRASERHPLILTVPHHPVVIRADAERLQRVAATHG